MVMQFILAPCRVCDDLVKLHGLKFHGRKIIIEEAKIPPRTFVNELFTSAVANHQQIMHKMTPTINNIRSRLPTATTEEQCPLTVHISMQLYQRKKKFHFFRTAYLEE